MLPKTTDIVIIGGGIVGCLVAYQLAKQKVRVLLLERSRFGSNASGATVGVISPLWHVDHSIKPMWDLGVRSLDLFPRLAAELTESGIDPEFRQSGVLKLAFSDQQVEELRHKLSSKSALDMGMTWFDTDDLLEREPEISPQVLGGVLSPGDGYVRGQRMVDSLVQAATRLGATFCEGTEVLSLKRAGNKVTGVNTPMGGVNSEQVLIAAGPWSSMHTDWFGEEYSMQVPIRPVKGERILLRKPGFLPKTPVRNFEAYVVPQLDGDILVGATREELRFDQVVTANGVNRMINAAVLSYPGLADAEFVSGRSGVRPATPDGMPVLGPIEALEGLSIAAGHDSVGIMLSPATAELVTQYLLDGNAGPLEPFRISRF